MNDKPVEKEMTPEEFEVLREDIAKQVIAGTMTSFPLKATINKGKSTEYTVGYRIRVPSFDDDVAIGAKAAGYSPRVAYDFLPFQKQQECEARATLEVLGEGKFEDWVPLDTEGRPDFGKMTQKKDAIYALFIEAQLVLTRFR